MSAFIEQQRADFGVEPICRTLGVSASAYYQRATGERSARSLEDERLLAQIRRVHEANYEGYGSRRVWKALLREGIAVARCTVERLMRATGSRAPSAAASRGARRCPTRSGADAPDLVERDFTAGRRTRCGWSTSRTCARGRASCSSRS